jgi:hypothetical protein
MNLNYSWEHGVQQPIGSTILSGFGFLGSVNLEGVYEK